LASAYEALLQFTRFDVKVDQLATLVPDLLALWPPIVVEPVSLMNVDLATLLAAVDLMGEAGAPLAQYARTADHSLHISLWLRRLGATLLDCPLPASHLACSQAFLAVLRALRRIHIASCESRSALAVTQASEIRSMLEILRAHLEADPAVLARDELSRIQPYL
jgi:hypothetical protein